MKKWTLIALSILSLSACSDNSSQNTSANTPAATTASSEKVYRVTIEHEFSPFIIPGTGTTTGFEAELLQEIGKKQGFQVKFEPSLWEQVFAKLDSGESDIAGSGIIMTSERMEQWDFSEPFIVAKYAVIAPANSTISKSADLKSKRIAASKGTALASYAESLGSDLVPADSVFLSIKETMKNNTEATMVNSVIADYYVSQYPDQNLKVVAFNDVELPIGFAVKKGNTELKQKINDGLAQVKSDGTYDRLKEKWHILNH